MLQFVSIGEQDFGAGIDQLSSEDAIKPGFSEDLLNCDPKAEGYLVKRKGYEGYAGTIPLRCVEVSATTASEYNLSFTFDSAISIQSEIDFTNVRSTPIIVAGRTSSTVPANLDFNSTGHSVKYYTDFKADPRKIFTTGIVSLAVPAGELSLASYYSAIGLTRSTSFLSTSNTQFLADEITLDKTSADLTINYTNTETEFSAFVYSIDKSVSAGESYVSATQTILAGATHTFTILEADHGLLNFNITSRLFIDNGTSVSEILPESVILNADGSVEITVVNSRSTSISVYAILSIVPALNILTGTAFASSSVSLEIENIESSFLFVECFLEIGTTDVLEKVLPESVVVDAETRVATVTFTNSGTTSRNFKVFWEFAELKTNKVTVTNQGGVPGSLYLDEAPAVSVYGFRYEDIYNNVGGRPGWVNHIDSYKSLGENRLVSSLGWNLFAAYSSSEGSPLSTGNSIATDFLLPTLYTNINTRIGSSVNLGPAFHATGTTPSRDRGYIRFDGGDENLAVGTSVSYDSGTGTVRYVLTCPNLDIQGTLSTIISTNAITGDRLTVSQAPYEVFNGTFKITAVTNPAADELHIWVQNDAVDSSDFDQTGCGMEVGIFTEVVPLDSAKLSPFLVGDVLVSDSLPSSYVFTVEASGDYAILCSGFNLEVNLPVGFRIAAKRSARTIPLRASAALASTDGIVVGDNIAITGFTRKFYVKRVNPFDDIAVTLTFDGTTGVISGLSSTSHLSQGSHILLGNAGAHSREYEISEIVNSTSVAVTVSHTTESFTVSGYLRGKTIEVDEEIPEIQDDERSSKIITVPSRWIPVEAPEDSFAETPDTHVKYFKSNLYTQQPFVRSVMAQDTLYLTNGDDHVLKYDGVNIYRAGLPRWQAGVFLATLPNPPAGVGEISIRKSDPATVSTVTADHFTVGASQTFWFTVGETIKHSADGETYVITKLDSANNNVYVDKTISGGATGTLTLVSFVKYYFRLNAVDINGNVVASSVASSEDFVVQLTENTAIQIRLCGFPIWDMYDFDRLEVQIYRTKVGGVAPFYLLTTLPLDYAMGSGYIDFIDSYSDDAFTEGQLDGTITALTGAELATTISSPPRAKYCTSAGNSLVLANIKGDAELDIRVLKVSSDLNQAAFDGLIWRFKKNAGSDVAYSVSDMVNNAHYITRTSGAQTITPATNIVPVANTSFTVTLAAHGLSAGNWVYMFRDAVASDTSLSFAGWWQVNSVTTNTFTVLHSTTPAAVTTLDANRVLTAVGTATPDAVPVWIGTDGNYAMANGNRSSTGPYEFVAIRRLANAINCSMRMVDVSISGMEDFSPWMLADAGNEYSTGQLVIRQPKNTSDALAVKLPSFSTAQIFVNGVKKSSDEIVASEEKRFPSRLLVSYANFPEMFDSPFTANDIDSDSAIDVNASDGQEITAVIPFFGESAFGASQQSGVIVVFKEASIYLVDISAKRTGQNAVQKLDSQGLGCTAPYSVAVTRDGVIFANESGIFKLGRNLKTEYLGQFVERLWRNSVNKDQLPLIQGHNYAVGRQYKLSFPGTGAEVNDGVFVYDSTREYKGGIGSWTRYDNHPVAGGWANLLSNSYFASTSGRVFRIRNSEDVFDYRDDSEAINMQATLRAWDFGDGAVRKKVASVVLRFRSDTDQFGTTVKTSADLKDEFTSADLFEIDSPKDTRSELREALRGARNGTSTEISRKVESIRFSINSGKCILMQTKITNNEIDEACEITGIFYRVSGLSSEGIKEAAATKRGS